MVMQLILSNKRWSLIIALVLFIFGQLAYTNHLASKIRKCDEQKQKIHYEYMKASDKAAADLRHMSELYEAEKSKEKVIYNEVKEEVRTIIKDNTIYRDCKLDDGMRDALRKATTTTELETL